MASRPSKFDFCGEPSKFARVRCVARGIGSLGDWKDVIAMLKFKKKGLCGRAWVGDSLLQGSPQTLG